MRRQVGIWLEALYQNMVNQYSDQRSKYNMIEASHIDFDDCLVAIKLSHHLLSEQDLLLLFVVDFIVDCLL